MATATAETAESLGAAMAAKSNGKRPATRILAALGREAWAITPGALEMMLDIAARVAVTPDAVLSRTGEPMDAAHAAQVRDGVAVIPIHGPIFRHATAFDDICGATSVDMVARALGAAVDDPAIKGIVLDVDSPGGQVTGIHELAGQIAAAAGKKRCVAYAGGMCASAAYWLSSSAGEIVADETAEIGSIGVVCGYTDTSARDAAEGVKSIEIVSSQSPKKRLPPTTKEGRAEVQGMVDGLADVFLADVAAGRKTTVDNVAENFGQGGVLIARAAVAAGMADRLGSLEGLISEIAASGGANDAPAWPQAQEAKMPEGKNPLTADAVSAAWLAANRPDLVASIKADAVAAERARVAAIMSASIKGHDKLVASAMADGTSAEALALAVLNAERDARAAMGTKVAADAAQAIVAPSTPAPDAPADAVADELINAAAAAANVGR